MIPVKFTCDKIDTVLEKVRDAIEQINLNPSADLEVNYAHQKALDDLYGIEDIMEELREANIKLREYAEKYQKENKQLRQQGLVVQA